MPARYRDYQTATKQLVAEQHAGDPLDTQLHVEIYFSKEGAEVLYGPMPRGQETSWKRRWDIDNGAGSILDAMEKGGAIKNDKSVVWLEARID